MRQFSQRSLLLIGLSALLLILVSPRLATGALAAAPAQTGDDGGGDPSLSISDEVCLSCHGQPGATMTLESGEILELYVDPQAFQASLHGELGYACVQCHRTIGNYPHAAFAAQDLRDASLQLYEACKYCHANQYALAQDSVHARAFAEGERQAAICTDCHAPHTMQPLTNPATGAILPEAHTAIPQTCAKCHSTVYEKYKESVHGSALVEGNPDVPTCIDCHGVHNITDPTTTAFRLNSPSMCARCHTDPQVMDKYAISTDVLSTYVADFHGTTVTIFEKQSPDAETNKPVCYDCHGVHDIVRPDDPEKGLSVRENLLARCQVCHPDATVNFPDAWLSHYIPSADKTPLVYYVNLFYKVFIPGVLGGMIVLVLLDLGSIVRGKLPKPPAQPHPVEPPPAPQQPPTEVAPQPTEAEHPAESAPPAEALPVTEPPPPVEPPQPAGPPPAETPPDQATPPAPDAQEVEHG